jgi:hypothetical protein
LHEKGKTNCRERKLALGRVDVFNVRFLISKKKLI